MHGEKMKKKTTIIVSCLAILTIAIAFAIFYIFVNRPSTELYIEPRATSGTTGQNFTINILVSNVADLYGWQLRLEWNSTLLEIINVTEGNFLKNGGNTFFYYENDTTDYIFIICTLTPEVPEQETPGISGNGVLATLQFRIKENGSCSLTISDTILIK